VISIFGHEQTLQESPNVSRGLTTAQPLRIGVRTVAFVSLFLCRLEQAITSSRPSVKDEAHEARWIWFGLEADVGNNHGGS